MSLPGGSSAATSSMSLQMAQTTLEKCG